MLTYDLTERENLALYDFIYRKIRDDILTGKIKAGEKLPPKRALAENLSVSVITIENAYAQLMSEGYIYSKERSGFYVEKIARQKLLSPPVRQETKKEKIPVTADFTSNKMYADSFPFSVWAKLMRETLLEDGEKLLGAQAHAGAYILRKAISDYLYRARAIDAPPENIVIGAGSEYICSLLVQLFGHDKVFGVEDPGYNKTAAVYEANGATCEYLPLDGNGVDIKSLNESKVDILHITPTHHYPTGIVTPISRRQEILRWADEREGRFIIEDDYDSEFKFSGRPIPTLRSSDEMQKVIYINTFSKSLSPSVRISYMILPDGLLKEYEKKLGFYSCPVPGFEQYTLAKFIDRGYFERHLSRMKNVYKKRREEILSKIASLKHGKSLKVTRADSGLHFIIKVDARLSDEELISRAEKLNIKISCLSRYSRLKEKKYEHCILINYSGEKYDDLSFLDKILE